MSRGLTPGYARTHTHSKEREQTVQPFQALNFQRAVVVVSTASWPARLSPRRLYVFVLVCVCT